MVLHLIFNCSRNMLSSLRVFLSFFLVLNCASPLVAAGWDERTAAFERSVITESFVVAMFFSVNAPLYIMSGLMTDRNAVADNAKRAAKKDSSKKKDNGVKGLTLIASGSSEQLSRCVTPFLSPLLSHVSAAADFPLSCRQTLLTAYKMCVFLPYMLLFCIILAMSNLPAAYIFKGAITGTRSAIGRPGFLCSLYSIPEAALC